MNSPRKFRGRLVNYSKEYPRVYWPEHPAAEASGLVAVHRVVGYELWGDAVFDYDVHHVNEDPTDWTPDNLELLEHGVHARFHNNGRLKPYNFVCGNCGESFSAGKKDRRFCSPDCFAQAQELKCWPSDETLTRMVRESNFSAVGRRLGVSDNAVRKRVRKKNLEVG